MKRHIGKRLAGAMIAAAASLAGMAPANAYWAYNTLVVNEIPGRQGAFEVIYKPRAVDTDFWCAAGDFTRRFVNQSGTTRVYLERPLGPSLTQQRSRSVVFTIDPSGPVAKGAADPQGMDMNATRIGQNYSAAHGWALCRDSRIKMRQIGF
ncbi:hypothetical protein [Tropicimonas sp. IMCC34043]|uniref:hypothetical protein n=1 Tax=Tropicimonas sp. IMCC34043 TaxID=2248760 RepID=UPI000E26D8DB|nr:hypothetical protein [Tropicimonas sp. IMCC34043]